MLLCVNLSVPVCLHLYVLELERVKKLIVIKELTPLKILMQCHEITARCGRKKLLESTKLAQV